MRLHPLYLTSTLLLAPALIAQVRPTEIEPNDTVATATAIALGTEVQATIVANEQDWYSFSLASAGRVRLHTAGLDTRMALYDATGTTLLAMDDDGRGSGNAFSSDLFLNLAAGSYAVQVVGYNSTTAGAYSIEYAVLPTKLYTAFEVEPNESVAAATVVTIPPTGAQVSGNLAAPTVVLSAAAAAATTATSIVSSVPLTASAYTGGLFQVRFTSGANNGLFRLITANTATALTTSAFPAVPAVGDTFNVEKVDVDFYRFTLTSPRTGIWFLVTEGDAPFVYGHRYELYDNAGTLLVATSTTAPAFGTNAANSSSLSARTSSIRVWPAGTYHIAIRYSNSQFAAPYNQRETGNYCLELFAGMTIGTGSTVAEAEPNNSVATATPLTFGQRGTGNLSISTGGDPSDIWGPFVLPTTNPVVVTFQSGRGAPSPIADTTVNVLRADGTTALSATTGNVLDWTSHGRTSLTFQGGGTYYVQVLSPGTSTTTQQGDYVVEVSNVMDAPYNSPSWTSVTANAACGVAPFPTMARQWASEVPALGEVFTRNVTNCPPAAAVVMMTGHSSTTWNGTPLPFDLTPLGAPGCTLNVEPVLLDVAIANATGTAEFNLVLPNDLSVRGFFLWEQAVVQNLSANAFGVQLTNYARLIPGDRSY